VGGGDNGRSQLGQNVKSAPRPTNSYFTLQFNNSYYRCQKWCQL